MLASIYTVTPDMASAWLATSRGNRRLRKAWVEELARAMRAGQFAETHQAIAFDEDSALVDGHHRLSAVVESGCTVRMLVVSGVAREAYSAIDSGIGRTVADRLGISQNMASMMGCLHRVGELSGAGRRIGAMELARACESRKADIEAHASIQLRHRPGWSSTTSRVACMLACWMQPHRKDAIIGMMRTGATGRFSDYTRSMETMERKIESRQVPIEQTVGSVAMYLACYLYPDSQRLDRAELRSTVRRDIKLMMGWR